MKKHMLLAVLGAYAQGIFVTDRVQGVQRTIFTPVADKDAIIGKLTRFYKQRPHPWRMWKGARK